MRVRFWGTRGSVPTPGPRTARFGGNTACVEVEADDGTRLVLDCGTGARELGTALTAAPPPDRRLHLLISHTHWDHIQGFPFFAPAYDPTCTLDIYSPAGLEGTLESSLSGQMQYTYFPVRLADLRARLVFHELGEGEFCAGSVRVQAQYLNHTAPALGYRLTVGGVTVVYASDHEPFWWPGGRRRDVEPPLHPGDQRHLAFLRGADVVIHDAQFLDREYPARRGWGHSTVEYVTEMALRAEVRQLVLFHHDPAHDDRLIASITRAASRRVAAQGSSMEVIAAAEGLELVLPEQAVVPFMLPLPGGQPGRSAPPRARLLVAGGTADDLALLRTALAPDGHRLLPCPPGLTLPAAVARLRPALVLLMAGGDLSDPLRAAAELRASAAGRELPIVVLLADEVPGRVAELLAQGTDIVARPFSSPMLRSRVRAWLARSPAGRRGRRRGRAVRFGELRVPTVFADLPRRERAALLRDAATCHLPPGTVLCRAGDPPTGVYYVREGAVQVVTRAPDGEEIVLDAVQAGGLVGELAVLDQRPRAATLVTAAPTVVDFVPAEAFLAALARSPRACLRLLRVLAGRLRATDRRVSAIAAGDLPERVARQLLHAVRHDGAAPLAVAALAAAVGVDEPRLERTLLLLEAGGFVRRESGCVRVTDLEGLLRFALE
ncbi:MAG TPA: cyclic nucleotide-binding domain-containing protein [Chloroflexota bacterium]|jgi:CRP-like cAMP-binding protein/phosphoribosyl 1,2-cyclic phosphodiesterase/CheY-like chemotaxis protein|nr:cyclic nucleotide-binding domain-containing protein [Chloroflexota bacterium]